MSKIHRNIMLSATMLNLAHSCAHSIEYIPPPSVNKHRLPLKMRDKAQRDLFRGKTHNRKR